MKSNKSRQWNWVSLILLTKWLKILNNILTRTLKKHFYNLSYSVIFQSKLWVNLDVLWNVDRKTILLIFCLNVTNIELRYMTFYTEMTAQHSSTISLKKEWTYYHLNIITSKQILFWSDNILNISVCLVKNILKFFIQLILVVFLAELEILMLIFPLGSSNLSHDNWGLILFYFLIKLLFKLNKQLLFYSYNKVRIIIFIVCVCDMILKKLFTSKLRLIFLIFFFSWTIILSCCLCVFEDIYRRVTESFLRQCGQKGII